MSLPAVVDYVTFMKVQSTAYLDIRFDWLFSIYVDLRRRRAGPLRLDPLVGAARPRTRGVRPDQGELRGMSLADPFTLSIVAIVALSLLGLPIGHAMIGGSILYLWLAGLDMGTAAEQLLNGMYTSYILLAVPLFIFAAELMNSGTHDRAAAAFLRRAGRPLPRRPRAGQRRAEHHLRRHVGLGDRRRRRHRQDDADDDDERRQVHAELRRRADRRLRR